MSIEFISVAGAVLGMIASVVGFLLWRQIQQKLNLLITIMLYRPHDRRPADHKYGDQFDEQIDRFVGGPANWRSGSGNRRVAQVSNPQMQVELHETGPVFKFVIQRAGEMPAYLSALASLISSWATARRPYRVSPAPGLEHDGTMIQIGDLKVTAGRDLTPEEIQGISTALFQHAKEAKS